MNNVLLQNSLDYIFLQIIPKLPKKLNYYVHINVWEKYKTPINLQQSLLFFNFY